MKKTITFFVLTLLALTTFAQGMETFDNSDISDSDTQYVDGSFVGNDGITWNYTQCRGDFEIDGKAIMLGRNRDPDATLESGEIPNGIGTLEFDYMQAYSSDVNLEVWVNDQMVGTVTSDGQQNEILHSPVFDVNIGGNVTIKLYNPDGGQVVVDNIEWTALGSAPTLTIVSPTNNDEFDPMTTSVEVQFNVTNFDLSSGEGTADGDGYIFFELDKAGASNPLVSENLYTTDPVELNDLEPGDYIVLMALLDNDGNTYGDGDVTSDTINFSIPDITDVTSIGQLRSGSSDARDDNDNGGILGHYYTLTSEAVLTFQQSYRNQKYIQDPSGAILIDDPDGKMSTSYDRYDGISGISGQLTEHNGILQFIPLEDAGAATSTGNAIDPLILTIPEFMANPEAYESQLIAFVDVKFDDADGSTAFATGTSYDVSDADGDTTSIYTNFYDADYIGEVIPQGMQASLVGIAAHHNGEGQFFMRDNDDIDAALGVEHFTASDVVLYPNPAINTVNLQLHGKARVQVYSLLGQRLINTVIDGNTALSIDNLKAGVYLVKIDRKGQSVTQKLIVE